MKRTVLIFAMFSTLFCGQVKAQIDLDTILLNPYLYYGNYPGLNNLIDTIRQWDLVQHTLISLADNMTGITEGTVYYPFHTDDTLNIVGIAYFSHQTTWHCDLINDLVDSNFRPIKTTHSGYDNSQNWGRIVVPTYYSTPYANAHLIYIDFFSDSSSVDLIGDFYISPTYRMDSSAGYSPEQRLNSVLYLADWYVVSQSTSFFPQCSFWVSNDTAENKVEERTIPKYGIPVLFPIITLPCEKIDSVRVNLDTTGCLHAEWSGKERQNAWVVTLVGGDSTVIDTVDNCLWELCGLQPGVNYTVSVRSRCTNLCRYNWSRETITDSIYYGEMPNPSGIDATNSQSPVFLLSPNPAKGTVTVEMDETQRDASLQTIQVVDMEGRVVLTQPWESAAAQPLTLDISGLAAGVYLVRLNTPLGSATRKLVVE